VDDEEGIRYSLRVFLSRRGFSVSEAGDVNTAKDLISRGIFDTAILDIRLQNEETGLDLVESIRERNPDAVILIVTGYGHLDTAVTAIRKGANDYLQKPLDNERILDSIRKNSEIFQLKKENSLLKKELEENLFRHDIVTGSSSMEKILRTADRVKDLAPNILITGESGTGKEILARYIHFTGNRKSNRFVSLNSAALSDSLLLSELFGHRKGAFTGAVEHKKGKFELAHRGTFFLDEVGDMSLDIQAKFLRVLEERAFEQVGGTDRIEVDTHVIAATNHDIPALIEEGRFRKDLYYRLNVIHFHLPPLRERREDIEELCNAFIRLYNHQYHKSIEPVSRDVTVLLSDYSWPGNIRELKNLINRAVILAEDNRISPDQIFLLLGQGTEPPAEPSGPGSDSPRPGLTGPLADRLAPVLTHYEKRILLETLEKNKNNRTRTAEELGLTRKTITRKIQQYDLEAKAGHE